MIYYLSGGSLKIFIFKTELSFWRENHKNDNWIGFPDFHEFMKSGNLRIFNQIFLKNDNLGLKINILKFLGIQSNFYPFGWVKCGLAGEPPTNGND